MWKVFGGLQEKNLEDPTSREHDEHYATHLCFCSWCPICVKARVRDEEHQKVEEERKSVKPVVSFDCKSFGRDDHNDDKVTQIAMRGRKISKSCAHT